MNVVRRAGFALLGGVNVLWGLWGVLAPMHFFAEFPGFGRRWTGGYPPYNQHLVTDLGSTLLLVGVLLVGVAIVDLPAATWLVTIAVTVFSAVHLAFHLGHRGSLVGLDYWLSVAALSVGVIGPPLLASTHRRA